MHLASEMWHEATRNKENLISSYITDGEGLLSVPHAVTHLRSS